MAARKKVTKTAKSGAAAQVIRSKPNLARGKGAETKTARKPAPKAARSASKTVAAKPVAAKPAVAKAARKPAASSKSGKTATQVKAEAARKAESARKAEAARKAKVKAEAARKAKAEAARNAETARKAASRKAEVSRKPETAARKSETRAQVEGHSTAAIAAPEKKEAGAISAAPEMKPAAAQAAPVAVKGVETPAAMKSATVAPATVSAAPAKALKPAPTVKTNERETSGGDQKTMKNSGNRHGFKLSEFVVYPAHGVGQIVSIEEQEVAGFKLELFVINFVKDKMTLRVPVGKVTGVGMRKLSDPEQARRSLEILTGRARVKRTMWSRRAQEYEAKINSGDINAIAEVVRDLFRSEAQPEQSYSERQLYEAALDRMMREIAAVQKTTEAEALKVIEVQLRKNANKRGAKPEGEAVEGEEAGIEEAA